MILADKSPHSGVKPNFLAYAILLLLALLLAFFLFRPSDNKKQSTIQKAAIFCGAEKISGDNFVHDQHEFSKGKWQSKEWVKTGSYSCKIDLGEGEQRAMEYELKDYNPGDTFRASVWRFRKDSGRSGAIGVAAKGEGAFFKKSITIVREEDGWEQLVLYFAIPTEKKVKDIIVFVSTNGKNVIYYDDLEIQKVEEEKEEEQKVEEQKALLENADLQHLDIRLENESIRKLENKRNVAYRAGILESSDDDWVKARLTVNDASEELKASLRLKGDWLDHLGSNKWSFRVKMKGGDTWNRLRVFSLQTPKSRFFLYEYILHKFWQYEDVLTPRYDFVTLDVNGKSRGVYAFEEHFDKVLVEFKERREGPILKMSEDGFWSSVKRQISGLDGGIDMDLGHSGHSMETASIEPFGSNKTAKSPNLKKQFEIGQNLLYQYRTGTKPVEEIFDIDRLAKFYAICDVMGAYHGLAWHNQRFYYNPVTSKLEPIGYDGFSTSKSKRNTLLGHGALNARMLDMERLDSKLFMSKKFTELYLRYLRKFSDTEYFEKFLLTLDDDLTTREKLIKTEFIHYSLNRKDLVRNVRRVNLLLDPFSEVSVKAYISKKINGRKHLQVGNTFNLPLEIVGYGNTKEEMTSQLSEPLLLESFVPRKLLGMIKQTDHPELVLDTFSYKMNQQAYLTQQFLSYVSLEVPESANYLFIRPLGTDTLFHTGFAKWSPPHNSVPAQELFDQYKLQSTDYMTVDGYQVYFKKGKHTIKEKILIPENYHVQFEAGSELDFVNQAALITRSPVFMNGTEEEPIIISSSDQSANGFTVLQAGKRSKLRYVVFDNLNTLNYKGWTLTGAVTFYESDVTIINSAFRNNHCEDGLNIVRSDFLLNSSVVSNTPFDGFDCDFCKGTVERSRFYKTGNDGMDFSGSNIMVKDCTVEIGGDKGISVGEDTDVTVYNTTISNAPIAVAAKDLSVLVVDGLNIKDCEQGFVAYQKKPEFGGSKIIVKRYEAEGLRRLHNIQKGCALQLGDKTIKGE